MSKSTCKTCRFWAPARRDDEQTAMGVLYADFEAECRYEPPKHSEQRSMGVWPRTSPDSWCAKHRSVCSEIEYQRACLVEEPHLHHNQTGEIVLLETIRKEAAERRAERLKGQP